MGAGIGLLCAYVLTLNALVPDKSVQYIVLNRAPGQGMNQAIPESLGVSSFQEVLARFPEGAKQGRRLGLSFIYSPFRTAPETTVQGLKIFLNAAEKTSTPVLVQIDLEQWWEARPDLWNWWDPSKPGYSKDNRNNVEWTGWSPDNAIKIAWRNWGRQIRVLPPPNYASPRYLDACRQEIRRLVPIVMKWQQSLPGDKKHLLIGIKLGHETSIGVNSYYLLNGNEQLARSESTDPVVQLKTDDVLARGMTQIGHAAVKTSGLRRSGSITERDLYVVSHRYLEFLCKEARSCGVPRELLFAHGAGWREGELSYDIPVNRFACPAWSFYANAADPRKDKGVQRNLAKNDALYWAATEWLLLGTEKEAEWKEALSNTLSDPKCRYVCIFNWEGIRTTDSIVKAVADMCRE